MFARLTACATFVADTNFVSGTQKMFLIVFRNILCPQQMFPSLRSMETQHSFCVQRVYAPMKHQHQQKATSTMCPEQCVLVCQYLKYFNSLRFLYSYYIPMISSSHALGQSPYCQTSDPSHSVFTMVACRKDFGAF